MTSGTRATVWLLAISFCNGAAAAAVPFDLVAERTLFAVVTHPAGAASGLGHHHLIAADSYQATLMVDEEQLTRSHFTLTVPVQSLAVDPPDAAGRVLPRLRALGIVDRPFPDLSPEDEETTRERIAAPEQLDARKHPTIHAAVKGIRAEPSDFEGRDFPWSLELALTVRGKTVRKKVPATLLHGNGRLMATALGQFRFSDFGIKPFQAAVGLIRNDDRFHVYVEVTATRAGAPAADSGEAVPEAAGGGQ